MDLIRHRYCRRHTADLVACLLLASCCSLGSNTASAGEWDISGYLAGELRIFPEAPAFPGQDDTTLSPSIVAVPEFVFQWNEDVDRLTFVPFFRVDGHDGNRTHADLRQASWLHIGETWDLIVGVDKVFWGVTESRHLVDIVNQNDQVEDVDSEDKLGQPMINLNIYRSWGDLGLFLLPYFRERTFPASDARLRGPLPVAKNKAMFESRDGKENLDIALRWSHVIGNWDIGLAYFDGTSREPRLVPAPDEGGTPALIPFYDLIRQASADAQLTEGAWLWKLEALHRDGHGDRFSAAVVGFEHTTFGVRGTSADLGLLVEYLYDDRNPEIAPPTALDDDYFLGARLTLNDAQDTSALIGTIIDRNLGSSIVFIETERRIGNSWRFEIEGRMFFNIDKDDPLFGFANDSFFTLRLSRFF